MKYPFNTIIDIHKQLFPKATYKSQLLHYNEEILELENATSTEEYREELADVVIVVISLMRFEETKQVAENLLKFHYFNLPLAEKETMQKYIDKCVDKVKLRVSDNRYILANGRYIRNDKFYKGQQNE